MNKLPISYNNSIQNELILLSYIFNNAIMPGKYYKYFVELAYQKMKYLKKIGEYEKLNKIIADIDDIVYEMEWLVTFEILKGD